MAASVDPDSNDNPSTYFVQNRKNYKELTRLAGQDRLVTAGMGGVLPEQADPSIFSHVLDVACGTGGWSIEAAQTYPTMSLVSIDISQRLIKYARAQAKAHQVNGQVKFQVMDALRPLEFPAASFDLVNLRYGLSFLRTWDWPDFLKELLRVTRPGGVIRVTDVEIGSPNSSPALTQLLGMFRCAFFRAGHFFTQESTGLIDHLARLLDQHGCEQVQTRAYTIEYRAGTAEGQAFYENNMLLFQTSRPFIEKRACASQDYEAVYRRALQEMLQSDFHATLNLLTVWGSKPRPKTRQLRQ